LIIQQHQIFTAKMAWEAVVLPLNYARMSGT
jgi:hypothetical protein